MKRHLCLLLVILMLCGCAAAPAVSPQVPRETGFGWSLQDEYRRNGIEMEDFSDNLDYDYIKWSYDGWYRFDPTPEEREQGIRSDAWCSNWNLTRTDRKALNHTQLRSCMVLNLPEEYQAVLAGIEATKAGALYNCGSWQKPEEIQRTWEGEFDENFFRDHDLILVDYCCEGNTYVRSRLESVTVAPNGHVTVEILWETTHAYTASQPGEVYWIVMPKGCTDVTVEYTETAWN